MAEQDTERMTGQHDFASFIARTRAGKFNTECSDVQQEMVQKVIATGRAGTITIKLAFKPGADGRIDVADSVVGKFPEYPRNDAVWYAADDGTLSRSDPHQSQLFGDND